MSAAIPDLWPPDIAVSDEPSPASILRQQGYLLGQKTRNFVVGEVRSSGTPDQFNHEFWVSAPLLNVRVRLFRVWHGIQFYPAKVQAFEVRDLPPSGNVSKPKGPEGNAANADEFKEIIKSVLADDEVRALIQSLAGQSRNLNDDSAE